MAISYSWLIEGEELLFQFFKKHSPKFMKIDWFAILLKVFMIFICALFIIKVKLVVTLSTAIVILVTCVSYLLVDILETLVDILETPVEEVVKKYINFMKRLKDRFGERNRIVHEANKVLLKEREELLSRTNLLTKQLEIICQERNGLEKLVQAEKDKVSFLNDQYAELTKCMSSERIAYKEWRKQETACRKKLEADKVMLERGLQEEVMRAEDLEKDLEDEMTDRKQIEEQTENIVRVLEEERKEKDRLEKEVQKYKAMVDETSEIIKYLQQDRDRNLNLKQVKEEMWNVIKSEIEKNAQCLCNELAQLRGSVEKTVRTEALNTEEKCDTLKRHLKKMIKQLEKLEKERDKLVEQNRVLSDQAKENLQHCVLDKFKGVVEMLGDHIVTHEQKTEEMLENQETLFKLLNESKSRSEGEVDSDDGYEVVE